jgi:hypothetical protein
LIFASTPAKTTRRTPVARHWRDRTHAGRASLAGAEAGLELLGPDYAHLEQRAEEQRRAVEVVRLAAAKAALQACAIGLSEPRPLGNGVAPRSLTVAALTELGRAFLIIADSPCPAGGVMLR